MLLETDPWVSSKLGHQNQSLLFIACSRGHADVVKILLNQKWMHLSNEDDDEEDEDGGFDAACFLEAVSRGHLGN